MNFITNSKSIHEKFGRPHRNVIRDIEAIKEDNPKFFYNNFCESEYTSRQNKKLKCFDITKDGAIMLIMSMTGEKAAKWKEAFITLNSKVTELDFDMIEKAANICEEMGYCYIIKSSKGMVKVGKSFKNPIISRIPVHSTTLQTFGDSIEDVLILKPKEGMTKEILESKLKSTCELICEEKRSSEWFFKVDINKLVSEVECEVFE